MQSLSKIVEYIATFSAFQFVFFALFLIITKKGKRVSNTILVIFLVSIASNLVSRTLQLGLIGSTLSFLIAPSIFLYTKSLIYKEYKLHLENLAHLVPALLFILSYLIMFQTTRIIYDVKIEVMSYNLNYWIIYDIVIDTQFFIYLLLTLKILNRYKQAIKDNYSSIEKINLSWLKWFVWTVVVAWNLGSLFYYLYAYGGLPAIVLLIMESVGIFSVFFISNLIVFKGLKYPAIFNGIEIKSKYQTSNLSQNDKDETVERLLAYLREEKPYLNPSLTLNELAEQLEIHPRNLSQIINECLEQNFYDFVNKYRVEEAKLLIANKPDHTFLQILFEVGFNSKAVFNNYFKKNTGSTPSEFKKTVFLQRQEIS